MEQGPRASFSERAHTPSMVCLRRGPRLRLRSAPADVGEGVAVVDLATGRQTGGAGFGGNDNDNEEQREQRVP
jgi:hypothetical protein